MTNTTYSAEALLAALNETPGVNWLKRLPDGGTTDIADLYRMFARRVIGRAAELQSQSPPPVTPKGAAEGEVARLPWLIEVIPVIVKDVPEACKVRLKVGVQSFHVGADYWDTREEGEWMARMLDVALRAAKSPVDSMVNRFLGWQLPKTFSPDCGISFKQLPEHFPWPVGTNLFSADEAKAMFEYALASTAKATPVEGGTEGEG